MGRVRAPRVRCRWASLRGVAGSDRRRRGRRCRCEGTAGGRGCVPLLLSPMAGAVGGVVGGHVLLYHSMHVQNVRQCFFCLRCCCSWCLAAGRPDLLQREKVPVLLAFSAKRGLTDLSIYVRIRYREGEEKTLIGGADGPVKSIGGCIQCLLG